MGAERTQRCSLSTASIRGSEATRSNELFLESPVFSAAGNRGYRRRLVRAMRSSMRTARWSTACSTMSTSARKARYDELETRSSRTSLSMSPRSWGERLSLHSAGGIFRGEPPATPSRPRCSSIATTSTATCTTIVTIAGCRSSAMATRDVCETPQHLDASRRSACAISIRLSAFTQRTAFDVDVHGDRCVHAEDRGRSGRSSSSRTSFDGCARTGRRRGRRASFRAASAAEHANRQLQPASRPSRHSRCRQRGSTGHVARPGCEGGARLFDLYDPSVYRWVSRRRSTTTTTSKDTRAASCRPISTRFSGASSSAAVLGLRYVKTRAGVEWVYVHEWGAAALDGRARLQRPAAVR